jgi:hypothetical protein
MAILATSACSEINETDTTTIQISHRHLPSTIFRSHSGFVSVRCDDRRDKIPFSVSEAKRSLMLILVLIPVVLDQVERKTAFLPIFSMEPLPSAGGGGV